MADTYGYNLVVNFNAGNVFPPIVKFSSTVGGVSNSSITIDEANLQITARVYGDFSVYGLPTVSVVASAPIASITLTPGSA